MNIENFQSGAYEQRYEYRAFLPNPICQEWLIADAELTDLLGRADRALGELNAFGHGILKEVLHECIGVSYVGQWLKREIHVERELREEEFET